MSLHYLEWQCTSNDPTTWSLGRRVGGEMKDIAATVERQPEGNWQWKAGGFSGREPSCDEAMKAAQGYSPAAVEVQE